MRLIPLIAVLTFASTPGIRAEERPNAGSSSSRASQSLHREGEDGPVILELGDAGLRPLHCRGHRFLAVMDAPGETLVREGEAIVGAAEKAVRRRALRTTESVASPGKAPDGTERPK